MNDTLIEIRPSRGIARVGLRELWTYRDLIYFFVWRDVKVRYKQTFFGATWAIIQPLVLMVVFTFVFGRVLQVATPPGVPKPIFYYAALVPWTLFATSLTDASASLVTSAALVRKIYFPRLILPDLGRWIELGGFRRGVEHRVRDDLRVRLGAFLEDRSRSPCLL